MERINGLIDRLCQQQQQNATAAQLLTTVQLLQAQLVQMQQSTTQAGTTKVAVTMPAHFNFSEEVIRSATPGAMQTTAPKSITEVVKKPVAEAQNEELKHAAYNLRKPHVAEEPLRKIDIPLPSLTQANFYPAFDAAEELPTLLQQAPKKEVHEMIGVAKESLNERLNEQKTELAHKLKAAPIKDLRKGIGINDRFVFIKELFRGDEAVYERSIKTINNFNIYSEAEYWMNRELKLKFAWDEDKELVQHFYALVRRRFS